MGKLIVTIGIGNQQGTRFEDEENQPSLLGVVTLEEALLAVDPVGQQLVPVEAMRL